MSVLLIGPATDPQIEVVSRELESRGVDADLWDVDRWPGDAPITVRQSGERTRIGVRNQPVDPTDYHTIYLRDLGFDPRYPEFESDFEHRPLSVINQLREYRGLVLSAIRYLRDRDVRVVNPPDVMGVHTLKPWQLAALADGGVPVPETVSTNDPDAVREFADRIGHVVYKPIGGGGHARPLEADDLTEERLSKLANSPVQFQERVDGDDVRVFVVDGEVVAAARIVSSDDALDYRSESHDAERIPLDELDAEIETAATRTADRLGLAFAGVDVIVRDRDRERTSDRGEFVVLEANPSPMFATFDELAGTSVASALATHLAHPEADRP